MPQRIASSVRGLHSTRSSGKLIEAWHEQQLLRRTRANGSGMSTMARLEWNDQQAALDQRLKGFMAKPDTENMEAVIEQMRAYAEAANNGAMQIPKVWTSYN
jgi:hypothetical protein